MEPGQQDHGAAYFDQWYADMAASPDRDAIVTRTLGLPAELQSTSPLPWDAIAEVTEALRLPQDGLLVDAACGRGGYGIEVARRSGARLRAEARRSLPIWAGMRRVFATATAP